MNPLIRYDLLLPLFPYHFKSAVRAGATGAISTDQGAIHLYGQVLCGGIK